LNKPLGDLNWLESQEVFGPHKIFLAGESFAGQSGINFDCHVSQIADKYVKKRFFSLENVTTKFSAVQKNFFSRSRRASSDSKN